MPGCQYLHSYRAGEILDAEPGRITDWAEWTEQECTHSAALNEGGCPYLDDFDVECPVKENELKILEDWAIRIFAGSRKDRFTRVRELTESAAILSGKPDPDIKAGNAIGRFMLFYRKIRDQIPSEPRHYNFLLTWDEAQAIIWASEEMTEDERVALPLERRVEIRKIREDLAAHKKKWGLK